MTPTKSSYKRVQLDRFALVLALGLLVATVVVALLGGPAEILKPSIDGADETSSDMQPFVTAITNLEKPLNLALMTIVPVGVTVGGGMLATGQRKGVQVMASSAAAGLVVLLGKGLVA